jgi:hypothetical protein
LFFFTFQPSAKANVTFQDETEPTLPLNLSTEPKIQGEFAKDFTAIKFPFDEPTKIDKGDALKIFVQKVGFLGQKKFILDDHQFLVRADLLTDEVPLLSSVLNILEEGLEHMLNNLRQFFKKEDHNLVYLTIYQSEMDSTMNSPAFEISNTSNQIIYPMFLALYTSLTGDPKLLRSN